jgi:phage shock protein PspC (stress-responsive transcriptional regulator)
MERVVTINLNGNPYQLDEPAFDALRAYLSRAEAALAENPDKAEIIRDLEQAIADKCANYLSPAKSVVSSAEMTRILEEMGPVEGESEGAGAESAAEPPRKRLYRIRDDAKIAGVCAGIGAYFDIDANIIRLLFILATLFTSGFVILVYIAMMFLIPSAHTSEEWAAAHGIPFNAQEVIDRAKREYGRFAEGAAHDWRSSLRAQRRAWREQMRAWRNDWRAAHYRAAPPPATPVSYVTRVFAGLFAFIFSIIGAALLIAFLVALFSLLNTGGVMGWAPPGDIPDWLAIVVLCIVYAALASPVRYLRRSSYATASGYRYYGGGADGFVTLLAVIAGFVLAYHFIPEFHDWLRAIPDTLRALERSFDY